MDTRAASPIDRRYAGQLSFQNMILTNNEPFHPQQGFTGRMPSRPRRIMSLLTVDAGEMQRVRDYSKIFETAFSIEVTQW
jgi:hypothetical protein